MSRLFKTLLITVPTVVSLWLLFLLIDDFKFNIVSYMPAFVAPQNHSMTMNRKLMATGLSANTPVSVQSSAWLAAFNSNDRNTLLAYHAAHFPYDVASSDVSNIDREMFFYLLACGWAQSYAAQASSRDDGSLVGTLLSHHNRTGGFDSVEVLNASAADRGNEDISTINVILREKKGRMYARAMMQVDLHNGNHPVTKFEINPTHTPIRFVPPERENEFRKALAPLTPARRKCVVKAISDALRATYIVPDVGEKVIRDLEENLDGNGDKHIRVIFMEPPPNHGNDDGERKPPKLFDLLHTIGFGFRNCSIEMIKSKKLGFLLIDGFVPSTPEFASHSAAIRAAISEIVSEISDTDALIIDLRYNGGGHPDTVAFLLSYLLDGAPVHLNDFVDRNGQVEKSYWTTAESELPKNAVRFGGTKPLFVLTNKETISGGEEMAYDLQALKRTRSIIGEDETTAGAANPVVGPPNFLCEEEFGKRWWVFGVPSLQPVNDVTGTNWEGVGVRSDVVVREGEDAKDVGRRMAMQALGLAKNADDQDETPIDL